MQMCGDSTVHERWMYGYFSRRHRYRDKIGGTQKHDAFVVKKKGVAGVPSTKKKHGDSVKHIGNCAMEKKLQRQDWRNPENIAFEVEKRSGVLCTANWRSIQRAQSRG